MAELYKTPIQYAELMKMHGPNVFVLEGVQEVEKNVVRGMLEYVAQLPEGTDLRTTPDYDRYGLLPGQEICHIGAFAGPLVRGQVGEERYRQLMAEGQAPGSLKERLLKVLASAKHCGVYIGGGMIAEVGGTFLVPNPSYKSGFLPQGIIQRFCLSTLADFKGRATKTVGAGLIVMDSPEDSRRDVVLARLLRALHVMGDPLTYTLVSSNCQYFSGYVSFGTWWSQNQLSAAAWSALLAALPEDVRRAVEAGAIASSIENMTSVAEREIDIVATGSNPRGRVANTHGSCVQGTCAHRHISTGGCACKSSPQRGVTGLWCAVDGKEEGCTPAGMDRTWGEWGWVSSTEKSCKSSTPPGGYVPCI